MSPPRRFGNRYEVVREIARGGMATVHLARDLTLDRLVALKVLSGELATDPAFVERFRREAQAAARLSHPNIVSVYDWGQEGATPFIVMEYVEGRTLREVIAAEGPLAPLRVAEIGEQIAAGLSFAHRHGIVHRDVKPGNVLLGRVGGVKVTDFGIARAAGVGDGLTQTGSVMGTAAYFSPEQAQGLPVDARSDVYSLGVVLYEMATGTTPFRGENPVSVAYQHVREPLPPPSSRLPGLPADLERVILTALAKAPDDRYQSADDLRADLLRFRRGEAVVGAGERAGGPGAATEAPTGAVPPPTAVVPAAPSPAATALPARRRRRGPVVALLVAVGILIGVVGGLLAAQLRSTTGTGTVTVPDVVGQPVGLARATIEAEGLRVRVERVANDLQPEGTVVRQQPEGGTLVDRGTEVTLVVSAGAGTVTVPDVVDQTFEDAAATLKGAGLQVERRDEPSERVEAGRVIRTRPAAGRRVEAGSVVVVFVSSGAELVTVPDVTGTDQVAATQTLNRAGFAVEKVTEPSDTVDAGLVIRTDPPAGAAAPRGSTVRLVVSSGPDTVAVPDVVGMTQSQATAALRSAGFTVRVVPVASTPANRGRVIAQSPLAGSEAPRGSAVTITVGGGPPGTTTTTTGP
jgi:serine/threonine-protein kinase